MNRKSQRPSRRTSLSHKHTSSAVRKSFASRKSSAQRVPAAAEVRPVRKSLKDSRVRSTQKTSLLSSKQIHAKRGVSGKRVGAPLDGRESSAARGRAVGRTGGRANVHGHGGERIAKSGRPSSLKHTPANRYTRNRSRQKVHTVASRNNELTQMNVAGSLPLSGSRRATKRGTYQSFTKETLFRHRLHTVVLVLIAVVIIALVAFGLGTCVYQNALDSAMALNDEDAKKALAPAEENALTYTLVAGLGSADASKQSQTQDSTTSQNQSVGALLLVRIDKAHNQISYLGIPNTVVATLSDGQEHILREAVAVGGEAELISAVSNTLGIAVNHYVRTTEQDFVSLVDALGGVNVNVEQKVDDPRVGTIVLDPGEQTLNGEQALTFARALNYKNGRIARLDNQKQLLSAVLSKAQEQVGIDEITTADALSKTFKTDYSYDNLKELASVYAAAQNSYYSILPGTESNQEGKERYIISSEEWSFGKERFLAGEDPQSQPDTSQVDRAKTTIEVLNGSGVDGNASKVGKILSQAGYDVKETGNAPSYVYDETLVVYRNENDQLAAQAVVNDLGIGRTVYSGSFYRLNTTIQVYVGKDWKSDD